MNKEMWLKKKKSFPTDENIDLMSELAHFSEPFPAKSNDWNQMKMINWHIE